MKNVAEKQQSKNIGLNVKPPVETCTDELCPFHGTLPVRGITLIGTVVSTKMNNSIVVRREFNQYVSKYERYMKKTSSYHAHCPECIPIQVGDMVRIAECKPLSKTISFVAIEKMERKP